MKLPPPESIETEASSWVVRRRAGLDAAGERELAEWLRTPGHRAAFDRLAAMAEVFQRVRAQGASTNIVTQLETRARGRRKRRMVAMAGIAAALVFGAGLWLQPRLGPAAPQVQVAAGAFEPLRRLPDGSIVELKEGAAIAVRFEPAYRHVTLLRGEALFRVEKDPARPFIVSARGVDVRAVGTAFNVRLDSVAVEVLVTEGKVRVENAAGGASLLPATGNPDGEPPVLGVGEMVLVSLDHAGGAVPAVQLARLAPEEIKRTLSWRLPRFEFDGMELVEAVQRMNRENRVQIVLANEALGRLRLSGTFAPDDPETFSRLAAASLGLSAAATPKGDILLRKP